MNSIACRRMIGEVMDCSTDVALAYLARSRMKRLLLSCAQMVASLYGLEQPTLPGPFHAPSDACDSAKRIAAQCNALYQRTTHLCQPSEPLEARWVAQWSRLVAELRDLDEELRTLGVTSG